MGSCELRLANDESIPITDSLARALPFISEQSRTGYLWIDQININQKDNAERGSQVALMGEIYGRCMRCLIWIDCDPSIAGKSDFSLAWSSGTGDVIRQLMKTFQLGSNHELLQPGPSIARSPSPLAAARAVTDHMLWFLRHPWFTRTWVHQEFVLPNEAYFLIGDFELPGHELERVFQLGTPQSSAWYSAFHTAFDRSARRAADFDYAPGLEFLLEACFMRTIAETRKMCGRPYTTPNEFAGYEQCLFINLLYTMSHSTASDPRDHAYALVGFAPFLLEHFEVNYDMPVEQVFASLLKAFIKKSSCLEFISHLPSAAALSRSRLNLPSWVPNWTVKNRLRFLCAQDNQFCAAGKGFGVPDVQRCTHYHKDSALWRGQTQAWNELRVAGKIIDQVQYTLRPMSIYQSVHFNTVDVNNRSGRLPWDVSTLDAFLADLYDQGFDAAHQQSKEALLRTLFMDGVQLAAIDAVQSGESLYREDIHTFGLPHYTKIKDIVDHILRAQPPSTVASCGEEFTMDYSQFPHRASLQVLHELCKIQYARHVIFSEHGRFGLVPNLVERGHVIAVLHGYRVPVLLRERRASTTQAESRPDSSSQPERVFNIVGECFLDGAMYGELADPDDENAEIFTLV